MSEEEAIEVIATRWIFTKEFREYIASINSSMTDKEKKRVDKVIIKLDRMFKEKKLTVADVLIILTLLLITATCKLNVDSFTDSDTDIPYIG